MLFLSLAQERVHAKLLTHQQHRRRKEGGKGEKTLASFGGGLKQLEVVRLRPRELEVDEVRLSFLGETTKPSQSATKLSIKEIKLASAAK